MATIFWAPRAGEADEILMRQTELMQRVQALGGIRKAAFSQKRIYGQPPWLAMPSNAVPIQRVAGISLPTPNGNDVAVVSFRVPQGYDGVITALFHNYTGSGFADGSGDLVWRLRIGLRWARDMGDMTIQLGSAQSPYQLHRAGILLKDGQLVRYSVAHMPGSSLSGGRIICGVFGWFYPSA